MAARAGKRDVAKVAIDARYESMGEAFHARRPLGMGEPIFERAG